MDLSHNGKVALGYAKAGILVFPCRADREPHKPSHRLPFGKATKRPFVAWATEASRDETKIRQWWNQWPEALVAIPCKPNKIFLIDTDRHIAAENGIEGFAALCEGQEEPMAPHPVTLTEYDGEHHLFRMPEEPIPTCAIGPGIETRGFRTDNDGGYFIAAGSRMPDGRGWRRMDGTPSLLREALPLPPQWLINLCKPQAKPREPSHTNTPRATKAEQAYAAATLDRVAAELAGKAPDTGRDNLLMSVATTMGRQIACDWIGSATVEGRLFDACKANGLSAELKEAEIHDKIKRGIEAGIRNPHPPLQDRPKTNGAARPAEREDAGLALDDFHAYMPMHNYIYAPTREMWPGSSVNARIPPPAKDTKANAWLDQHRPVEQMTWAPGEPMLIAGRLISEGGWIERSGVTCFNLYRPPII
jgi:Bifunctional DNA primase/polymerase, N-terminal